MSSGRIALLLLLVILGVLGSMSAFIVDQREIAMRFQFGEIKQVYKKPGLYFMTPFVNKIKKLDNRILTMDKPKSEFWTGDQKQLLIDYFAKWRITDPVRFYRKTQGSLFQAREILSRIINAALTDEIRKLNITEVISSKRQQVMRDLVRQANLKLNDTKSDETNYGLEVLDVRVKQIEFPDRVQTQVYRTMIEERKKRSTQHRSEGKAKAKKIRAIANKEETIILSKARQQALQTKGKGDAEATKIYANAYGRNKEFYAFYRSLEAYVKSFKDKNDILVLDPNSEFFKYFDTSKIK